MTGRLGLVMVLVLLGAGWGMTQPLAKIAVSQGYQPLGILVWQLSLGALALGLVTLLRGQRLPLGRPHLIRYLIIALVGSVLPGMASFRAAMYLPAGVISILLSLIPMFSFPIALALANDRFDWGRLAGLGCGMAGVLLIAAPEASLPDRAMLAFLPLALVGPVLYALEGNIVARWGTAGLDPVQLLLGASILGALICAPLAVINGSWIAPLPPFGAPDRAILASSLIHALVYAGYVWVVGVAGAVFAAQVSYLVTGFGVLWSMLWLGEGYSGWVWGAMAAMMAGLALVQPRANSALVPRETLANDTGQAPRQGN